MTEAILALAGGRSQIPFLLALRGLGLPLVVVDQDEPAPCRALADYFLQVSTHDPNAIMAATAKQLPADLSIRAVLTRSSGYPTVTQAILSRKLGVPAFSQALAEAALDKQCFLPLVTQTGLSAPRSWAVAREVPSSAFPVIVRPAVTRADKHQVLKVSDPHGLAGALVKAGEASGNGKADIVEYVEGDDLILIGCRGANGLEMLGLVREFNTFLGEQIVNMGYQLVRQPSDYPVAGMLASVEKLFSANGGGAGVFLASFRATRSEHHWIELHLDFGGDLLFDGLLAAAYRRDMFAHTARRLLWQRPAPPLVARAAFLYTVIGADAAIAGRLDGLAADPDTSVHMERVQGPLAPMSRIGSVCVTREREDECVEAAQHIDALLDREAGPLPGLSDLLMDRA